MRLDFVTGDATGLAIPAHGAALLAAGPDFLTQAFRRFGAIAPDDGVARILGLEPCAGGSTGAKFFLSLELASGPRHTLFLKFSRDFADERRDWQRTEMESEARFVALSRRPGFPVRVPRGWFADYHAASGTGVVITECIAYGEGGIEPHRRKCLDWQTMADPPAYYRATVSALGRLAGTHKAGRLAADVGELFPWNPETGSADPIRYTADELDAELERCFAFARDCPRLLPDEVREPAFLAQMRREAHRVREAESVIRDALVSNPALIALNHWNAHIDNCWFWREDGQLHCGLIDWGRVGQITFGAALWGGLSAAHHDVWNHHLDDLLGHFLREYAAAGGPPVALEDLRLHLNLHMAAMGVARVLAFPEIIRFRLPQCGQASGPRDAMFESVDPARNCLSVYTVFLQYWRRHPFDTAIARIG